jgi:hypothetical protein
MATLCTNDGWVSDDGHSGVVHMATRLGPARTYILLLINLVLKLYRKTIHDICNFKDSN